MRVVLTLLLGALAVMGGARAEEVTKSLNLFGGSATWKSEQWSVLNDKPRGGHSDGELLVSPDSTALVFTGSIKLDKNNRGFAAVVATRADASSTSASAPFWDFSAWDGLKINVRKGDGKKYSLNLRTPEGKVDGESVDYKFIFETLDQHPSTHVFEWEKLIPTIRGERVSSPKFEKGHVEMVSLMCSSLMGRQKGEFEIVFGEVAAVKIEGKKGGKVYDDEL